ncbi:hypothetical protein HO173_012044 [Letharia columbiana]|uniref:Fungal N-terminal domain-containing protein n=1 Tax=Letharia columbiana TaxID=112416 RepID=A0A8H6CQA7_9LECA|nr:uncharacterized protein HO173_012044 [Letharia columbiana]KAF6227714.1 hypothetical protein HO173_012044 [Letharia columbiana]
MADPFSTVAAVVSLADVMIRACGGISNFVVDLRDAPNAVQHSRQILQNVHSVLENLRLYVIEYGSSKLFIEQHQLLAEIVKKELLDIHTELDLLHQFLSSSGTQGKISQRLKWVLDDK